MTTRRHRYARLDDEGGTGSGFDPRFQAGTYTRPTFQLNLSALHGIGGARRGPVARVNGEFGGV